MSPRLIVPCFVLAAMSGLLAGCGEGPSAPSAVPPPIRSAKAEEPATSEDSGQGNGYAYHIRYPQLAADWKVLGDALRTYAAARKKDFLDARLADETADGPNYDLDLEFNISRRTSDFVSALGSGSAYTGGAHGNPILVSFNLHLADDKLITIEDLFTDRVVALRALSDESRRQLEGRYDAIAHDTMTEKQRAADRQQTYAWIEKGTEPIPDNFRLFLIDGLDAKAIGLTLNFPPYQVASYADGSQQVEVPAKVFYNLLKPEYRDAFMIDTEADKIAPGVR